MNKMHSNPQAKMAQIRYHSIPGVLLALGMSITLAAWGGQTYWPLAFSLAGMFLMKKHSIAVPKEMQPTVWGMWICFAVYSIGRIILYLLNEDRFNIEPLLPFWIFPFAFYALIYWKVSQRYFWYGVMGASLLALLVATYQHFVLNQVRANGFINAIPFGDTCVVLSLAAVIGATGKYVKTNESRWFQIALIASAAAAAYTSLLSGSKGGWLSLITVLLVGAYRYQKTLPRQYRVQAITVGLIVFSMSLFAIPDHVYQRVQSGVAGGVHWIQTGEVTEGSVSYRLEMWSMGLELFKRSPWTGMNEAEWVKQKVNLIEQGHYPDELNSQITLDSEYIGALSTNGVFGLLTSISILIVPYMLFSRLNNFESIHGNDFIKLGQWTIIIFSEFGLSISLWGVSAFRQTYTSWLILILAMIALEFVRNNEKCEP